MTSLLLTFALLIPLHPHTQAEQRAWEQGWVMRVKDNGVLNEELVTEYVDFQTRHIIQEQPTTMASSTTYRGLGSGVEQWRGLVQAYFGSETNLALCVMVGESNGNPNAQNPRTSAAGLFQIMGFWWDKYGGDRYDPETNVKMAKVIRDQQGWSAWTVYSRGECS